MFHVNVNCGVVQLTASEGKAMVGLGFYLFHRGLLVTSVPSGAHDMG
jgi:hypothetical protein